MVMFKVGARVEANFEDQGHFYPGVITKTLKNGTYHIAYDDGDVEKSVSKLRVRKPKWQWLDCGQVGKQTFTRCHDKVLIEEIGEFESGDLIIVGPEIGRNHFSLKRWNSVRHKKVMVDYRVAQILCFYENYTESDCVGLETRLKRNPYAKVAWEADTPMMEVRWFYFPERVYKRSGNLKQYLPGQLFETADVQDEIHANRINGQAHVTTDRMTYINLQPTQQSQEEDDMDWLPDGHKFLCCHFFDHHTKRLRFVKFDRSNKSRWRQHSNHVLGADLHVHATNKVNYSEKRHLDEVTANDTNDRYSAHPKHDNRKRRRQLNPRANKALSINDYKKELHDKFTLASNELQLSAIPQSLPCREKERQKIYDFLHNAIRNGGRQATLYISGVPGTGKTATVMEVVRSLQHEAEQHTIPYFKFVKINAMHLAHPLHAYRDILFKLTGQIQGTTAAIESLQQHFAIESSRPTTVLLVDEIDFLATRKQEVLYNLFEWPSLPNSKLLVLGIANTMDLPERLLPKISSRASMERVPFAPYTARQVSFCLVS